MKRKLILAIDQGTSGSKAILFTTEGEIVCDERAPLESFYPQEGYVEQKGKDIYSSVLLAIQKTIESAEKQGFHKEDIECCGISNQRETFLIWDERGNPLCNAIVWQCKRSTRLTREMKESGKEGIIRKKTGLFLDPYFSGTKISWLNKNNRKIAESIQNREAFFGTIDTWLLWNLTEGQQYKTDYTNASRTMLFNLEKLCWDKEVLEILQIERLRLPEAIPSSSEFGLTCLGGILSTPIPVTGMIGDSHAAAFGERCFHLGDIKATMGTGSSILMNTEKRISPDQTRMVSTICWSTKEKVSYALEGLIVSCGSTLNWLQNTLGLFDSGREADRIAMSMEDNGNVYLIPAFSGLGAPWWKMEQKAQICGLSFDSGKKHLVRAGLESIGYQVADVIFAMKQDCGSKLESLQIDGGISSSPFIQNMLSNLLPLRVFRCSLKEASALGAALMAGLGKGIYQSIDEIEKLPYNCEILDEEVNPVYHKTYLKWLEILKGLP